MGTMRHRVSLPKLDLYNDFQPRVCWHILYLLITKQKKIHDLVRMKKKIIQFEIPFVQTFVQSIKSDVKHTFQESFLNAHGEKNGLKCIMPQTHRALCGAGAF